MKSFDNWLNRFCRKCPWFNIPNLVMYVVVGNLLVFLMDQFSGGTFSYMLYFNRSLILSGQVWRLITFIFIPDSYQVFSLILSLYFTYFIGSSLERAWGSQRFTVFYFMGILLNILIGMVVGGTSMTYVNLSLFFAFATLYPDAEFLFFFFLPVKAKWLAWINAAAFVFSIFRYLISGFPLYALIPIVAVLNYVLFFWQEFIWRYTRVKHRTSPQTVNFKKAQQAAKQNKGYLHKCSVCGRTDTEFPDLEFRYCSKCNGYYCYCMDHIHNHVHIE